MLGAWMSPVNIAPHAIFSEAELQKAVEAFERPGPRYTSYPTTPQWAAKIEQAELTTTLSQEISSKSLSLYIHLPFCEKLCHFCACHKIIDPQRDQGAQYLEAIRREVLTLKNSWTHPPKISQLHWGGGTPTYYSPAELERLFRDLREEFVWTPDAEISIEANPVVTTIEHLQCLRRLGFNRISFGVQDFDPTVQDVINRHQTFEQTQRLSDEARHLGFDSLNVDLIYGLPKQSESSLQNTLEAIAKIRPERIAFYSFAKVPWKHPFQRRFLDEDLPTGLSKIRLYLIGRRLLMDAGYEPIGMDHFALPGDELFDARQNKTLHRNFMGYTTRPANALLGLGLSSISMFHALYWQNVKRLSDYYRATSAGLPVVERGFRLRPEDILRRDVIMNLMCNFEIDFSRLRKTYGIDFSEHFSGAFSELQKLADTGHIDLSKDRVVLRPLGQLFVRNLAMLFDEYLSGSPEDLKYSSTV